jgi:hypothetical protein
VKRIEHLIWRISARQQHRSDRSPRAPFRDEVYVIDRAGQKRAAGWRLQVDRDTTQQSDEDTFPGSGVDEAKALVDHFLDGRVIRW